MYVYRYGKFSQSEVQFNERTLEVMGVQQENLYCPRLDVETKFLFWNKRFIKSSKYDLYVKLHIRPVNSNKRLSYNDLKTLASTCTEDKWEVIYSNKYWVITSKDGEITINDTECQTNGEVLAIAMEGNRLVCVCKRNTITWTGKSDTFRILLEDYSAYTSEAPKDYIILREGRLIHEMKFNVQRRIVKNRGGIYTLDENEVSYEDIMNVYLRTGKGTAINVIGSRYQVVLDPCMLKVMEQAGDTFEVLLLFDYEPIFKDINFVVMLSDDVLLYPKYDSNSATYVAYKDTVLYLKLDDMPRCDLFSNTVAVIRTPDAVWLEYYGFLYKIEGTVLTDNSHTEVLDCTSGLTLKQLKRKILFEVN